MRISPINTKTIFKSHQPHVMGYDDEISQARREFIRENIETHTMPYYNILENNKRLEEYELKKLISTLRGEKINQDSLQQNLTLKKLQTLSIPTNTTAKTPNIDFEAIDNLELFNQQIVSKKLGTIRGQTLQCGHLSILKQAGIERIVDLAGFETLEENCNKEGLEYLYYPVTPYFFKNSPLFKTEEECKTRELSICRRFGYSDAETKIRLEKTINTWKQDFNKEVEHFIKFITTMQKGRLYIGCEYGTYTTDNALMLNAFFNPAYHRTPKYVNYTNKHCISKFESLLKNLSPEHEKVMGWTPEFKKLVSENIKRAIQLI